MVEKITKEMGIMEIVQNHPETVEVFAKHGLHCIGCAAAHFENLAQGCEAHGIDVEKLVEDMNKSVESAGKKEDSDKKEE